MASPPPSGSDYRRGLHLVLTLALLATVGAGIALFAAGRLRYAGTPRADEGVKRSEAPRPSFEPVPDDVSQGCMFALAPKDRRDMVVKSWRYAGGVIRARLEHQTNVKRSIAAQVASDTDRPATFWKRWTERGPSSNIAPLVTHAEGQLYLVPPIAGIEGRLALTGRIDTTAGESNPREIADFADPATGEPAASKKVPFYLGRMSFHDYPPGSLPVDETSTLTVWDQPAVTENGVSLPARRLVVEFVPLAVINTWLERPSGERP